MRSPFYFLFSINWLLKVSFLLLLFLLFAFWGSKENLQLLAFPKIKPGVCGCWRLGWRYSLKLQLVQRCRGLGENPPHLDSCQEKKSSRVHVACARGCVQTRPWGRGQLSLADRRTVSHVDPPPQVSARLVLLRELRTSVSACLCGIWTRFERGFEGTHLQHQTRRIRLSQSALSRSRAFHAHWFMFSSCCARNSLFQS